MPLGETQSLRRLSAVMDASSGGVLAGTASGAGTAWAGRLEKAAQSRAAKAAGRNLEQRIWKPPYVIADRVRLSWFLGP